MKKIDLSLNYKEIKVRIEADKGEVRPSEWAKKIGVSINIVSNIHGKKGKDTFSMEYVVAVSKATGKPVEWYLYGLEPYDRNNYLVHESVSAYNHNNIKDEFCCWSQDVQDACRKLKKILESGDPVAASAIQANLEAFADSVDRKKENKEQRKEIKILTERVRHLEKRQEDGISTGIEAADDAGTNKKAM